jgi:predicted TIM-barrel fold metal-dependent hydrolase
MFPPEFVEFIDSFGDEDLTGKQMAERLDRFVGNKASAIANIVNKAWNQPGGNGADPKARNTTMNAAGIDVQFINVSIGLQPATRAIEELSDRILARELRTAYNTWACEAVEGYSDRQIPVINVVLDDLDWALEQVRTSRERGSRAVQIPAQPVDGKSLCHPDFDRFWAACQDLGMAVVFHIAFAGKVTLAKGWYNTGGDWRAAMALASNQTRQLPEIAISAMILGGVLERFPRLIVMSQEMDIGWVPYWVDRMDRTATNGFMRRTNRLPLLPSEYVRRQVFVSGLCLQDRIRPAFDGAPPDTIVFASDWPHPEGGPVDDAIPTWTQHMGDLSEGQRESFLGAAVAKAMQLA